MASGSVCMYDIGRCYSVLLNCCKPFSSTDSIPKRKLAAEDKLEWLFQKRLWFENVNSYLGSDPAK